MRDKVFSDFFLAMENEKDYEVLLHYVKEEMFC